MPVELDELFDFIDSVADDKSSVADVRLPRFALWYFYPPNELRGYPGSYRIALWYEADTRLFELRYRNMGFQAKAEDILERLGEIPYILKKLARPICQT
jgi:hypothetical protein